MISYNSFGPSIPWQALSNPRVLPSLQGRRDELEKNYESVQRWMLGLRSLTGSEYTIKRSLNAMLHYCDWTGKDPDALVSERIQDLKQDDVRIRGRHEDLALKYFQTIKSRGSAVNMLAYLKSFYRHNYVPLQCKVPQRWRVTSEKVPTQGEIRKMMSVSDMRDRAMIAVPNTERSPRQHAMKTHLRRRLRRPRS